ncbi:MAG: cell division protein FtsQ/DivIB [Lachnospiraceae bacterium]|jgi:cell division septal protein FtsQ|nr:cell division protein FtsQ/DivIB [Lachnospiraceae bacterium]
MIFRRDGKTSYSTDLPPDEPDAGDMDQDGYGQTGAEYGEEGSAGYGEEPGGGYGSETDAVYEDEADREYGGGTDAGYADKDDYSPESIKRRAEALREESLEQEAARRAEEEEWRRASRERKRRLWWEQHRKRVILNGILSGVLLILVITALTIYRQHEIVNIEVTGNTIYTDEQIIDTVCKGPMGHNSLYLALKYRNKTVENVPFVEKMTVDILSADTVRITVYEKALAGYVDYLGNYMYFTRDGTIVEASSEKVSGIPEVTGLKFDYIALNEKLPVENNDIFQQILDITQLLDKYKLSVDRLYFDSYDNVSLFSGGVRADLGQNEYMEEKISNLAQIIPKLSGKTGTIDMTGYTPDQQNILFVEKKEN